MLSRLEEESRGQVLLGRSELAYIDSGSRMASSAFDLSKAPVTFIFAVIRTTITGSKEARE
jgi:hypothetical protein